MKTKWVNNPMSKQLEKGYTASQEISEKVKNAFQVELPKCVNYGQIDEVASFIVDKIIIPQLNK